MRTHLEYVSSYLDPDAAVAALLNERVEAVERRFPGATATLRDVRMAGAGITSDVGTGHAIWSFVLIFDVDGGA